MLRSRKWPLRRIRPLAEISANGTAGSGTSSWKNLSSVGTGPIGSRAGGIMHPSGSAARKPFAPTREIVEKSQPVEGTPACEIGQTYASLPLPKIYCWGGKHLSEASQRFLNQVGLQNRTFKAASHW